MDIQKNKQQQHYLKRFTLTTIASTILALHIEVANATSCPSQIIGTALAAIVCTFDGTTGSSVTVNNGGVVGGINMNSYLPVSPSFLTINAGGSVSNATGVAIAINSSSLSNGLSNSGTISSGTGTGIAISSSTLSGGLSNSGLISAGGVSLAISNSIINGNIFNNGMIISNTSGTGIRIASSNINGSISNSGTIRGSGVDEGIAIFNGTIVHGSITNTGSIEAPGSGDGIIILNSSTINGGISNSGRITSAAHSGIAILNVSDVLGNIFNSGTISGGTEGLSIHNASAVGGSILNSGTLSGGQDGISIFSSTTISGGISNSGTIRGNQTGIAVFSSSTVAGGISNSGTIQGGTHAIFISDNSNVSDINILGQNARIIGDVDAPNTTVNIVNGAKFTSEGSYEVNAFNIASNALFTMAAPITVATSVNNAGTFITNTPQTITGNYIQNAGGVFQTQVSSATQYGRLIVNGTVDLSQSGHISVQLNPNFSLRQGSILLNVISGNTLIFPINGFHVSANSFLWTFSPTVNNTGNGVNLTATINPEADNVCRGTFCQDAATTIIGQVGAGNSIFAPYATLPTASALKQAASQATPELTNENVQATQLITRSVMDIVPMWSALHGQSAGDAMLYQPGKLWIKPYGASMIQDESNTVPGFNASAYGVVLGKDIQREEGLLGGALAVGKDDMSGKSVLNSQSIDSDTYQGLLYVARKFPHHIYLAGQGLVGYGNNDTKRVIPLYASTARGSYNSWFTNLRAQLGWNFYPQNSDWILTPELDASYLFINQGSYRESGSLMDLSVASNNNSSLVLGAYGHAAYRLTPDLALTGYAGVARNALNSRPQTTATFVAGGPSFTTFGVQFNETVLRGGVGVTVINPVKPLRMNLNYDIQKGNGAYSGVGSFTITYTC